MSNKYDCENEFCALLCYKLQSNYDTCVSTLSTIDEHDCYMQGLVQGEIRALKNVLDTIKELEEKGPEKGEIVPPLTTGRKSLVRYPTAEMTNEKLPCKMNRVEKWHYNRIRTCSYCYHWSPPTKPRRSGFVPISFQKGICELIYSIDGKPVATYSDDFCHRVRDMDINVPAKQPEDWDDEEWAICQRKGKHNKDDMEMMKEWDKRDRQEFWDD